MNWNKLIVVGGVALALSAIPAAHAQRGGGRGGHAAAPHAGGAASAPRSSVGHANGGIARSHAGRSGNWNNGVSRGGRNWHSGRGGNWGHHRGHRGRGFYPYYAYDPFGYGYGYGYPFWGASANFYYNDYDRPARGESIAVEIQRELAQAGYYHGAIDGVIGNGTRQAIRAYERANGLPVDGRIDDGLLDSMGLN
ncbi:MAG TPA: peptidoglycan-binding domain-containing protein [Chthoniobacterales bacterium]|nr:peptidoglycan-binding domain-containing protein [Chthoniobacterales bacterium]